MDLNEEERAIYEARLKWWRDEVGAIRTAELKGREEGRKEGREEGEILASHHIARKLLQSGASLDEVMKVTGLSLETIKLLAQD